jgi:hypothetical protein
MPAISYSDWSGGLDRRLSVNSQDANKLWTLRNAYVTTGKRLKKRPGLRLLASGLTGSFGLKSVNGALNVFCDTGAVFTAPTVTGLTITGRIWTSRPPAPARARPSTGSTTPTCSRTSCTWSRGTPTGRPATTTWTGPPRTSPT